MPPLPNCGHLPKFLAHFDGLADRLGYAWDDNDCSNLEQFNISVDAGQSQSDFGGRDCDQLQELQGICTCRRKDSGVHQPLTVIAMLVLPSCQGQACARTEGQSTCFTPRIPGELAWRSTDSARRPRNLHRAFDCSWPAQGRGFHRKRPAKAL